MFLISYALGDEKPKEVSKPYMDEIPKPKAIMAKSFKAKTINHHADMSKLTFETCNTHLPWLKTPFDHPTYK